MVKIYAPKTTGNVAAVRLDENNSDYVSNWCGGLVLPDLAGSGRTAVEVPTLSSTNAVALIGDWIVKSSKNGRFSVMTNAEFEDKYSIVKIDPPSSSIIMNVYND